MMKKNRYIVISVILLALIAIGLILTRSKSTFKRALSDFALDDTANVTMIYMSDKNNNSVKLTRRGPGKWMVNDRYQAQKLTVEMLLRTMLDLEVREPVAKVAHNSIIRQLAVASVKVEIYQMVYRIDLFGFIRWFPHEKLTKVYYVGGATPSNQGSFMLMEGSSEPFVTYLPAFRGFVSPRYSTMEKDWRDYTVFRKTIPEIRSVKVEVPETPAFSFEVKNNDNKSFTLISLIDNQEIREYDTLRLLNFLAGFRNLSFEALLNDMDKYRKDSVLASTPFIIITLTDTAGVSRTIKTYHMQGPEGQTDMEGRPMPYDLDRLYALVNEGQDFTVIQYFSFDKVLRPKTFFLRESAGGKNQ
jgi:hypothetical protein